MTKIGQMQVCIPVHTQVCMRSTHAGFKMGFRISGDDLDMCSPPFPPVTSLPVTCSPTQQAQREKKEKEDDTPPLRPSKPPGHLNTNAKPFVPPAITRSPAAPASSLNTNAKPFIPPTTRTTTQAGPSNYSNPAPAQSTLAHSPLFVPTQQDYGWSPNEAGGRHTTVQQLFQEHQHMQQQQQMHKGYETMENQVQLKSLAPRRVVQYSGGTHLQHDCAHPSFLRSRLCLGVLNGKLVVKWLSMPPSL